MTPCTPLGLTHSTNTNQIPPGCTGPHGSTARPDGSLTSLPWTAYNLANRDGPQTANICHNCSRQDSIRIPRAVFKTPAFLGLSLRIRIFLSHSGYFEKGQNSGITGTSGLGIAMEWGGRVLDMHGVGSWGPYWDVPLGPQPPYL